MFSTRNIINLSSNRSFFIQNRVFLISLKIDSK